MKKGLLGWFIGFIMGVAGVFAVVTMIFKKLCDASDFMSKFKSSLMDMIEKLLYGTSRYYHKTFVYDAPYNNYSSSYGYASNVVKNIREKKFKYKEEADKKIIEILKHVEEFGEINVTEMYDILGFGPYDSHRRYLDDKFSWKDMEPYGSIKDQIKVHSRYGVGESYIVMPFPVKREF